MRTLIEASRDGTPLRVFHRAGKDGTFSWTHPMEERETCIACTQKLIPEHIKKGKVRP